MRARAQIKSHPIHPMLVAFPIGLWVGSFVFDVISISRGNPSFATAGFCGIAGAKAGRRRACTDCFPLELAVIFRRRITGFFPAALATTKA